MPKTEAHDPTNPSELFHAATLFQKVFGMLAILFAIIGVILVVAWMQGSDTGKEYLGGLNWKDLIFNYHPIFMSLGLIVCGMTSVLSYRLLPLPKWLTKSIHGFLHTTALSFAVIGLTCVIVGNNYPDYNTGNAYYANMYSLHSFIGIAALIVFSNNYVLGALHFLMPLSVMPVAARKRYMPLHMFMGGLGVVLALMAAETGLMELSAELCGGGYAVTKADTNPALNYHLLKAGCRVANGSGVMYLLALVCFLIAIHPFHAVGGGSKDGPEHNLLLSSEHGGGSYT